MGYKNVIRVIFSGPVSTQDVWNCGLVLSAASGDEPQAATSAEMNALAGSLGDCWANVLYGNSPSSTPFRTNWSSATKFTTTQTFLYEQSGAGIVAEGTDVRTAVAGSSGTLLPVITACCVTLQTPAFGRSGRGRMYLPMTAGVLASGTQQFAVAQSWSDTFASFIHAINTGSYTLNGQSTALTAGVWSDKQQLFHPITAVRVDGIPDTQRGRQSKATSARFTSPIT